MMSAWDVIRHEFESRHVQAFLLWQAYQTLVPIDSPGSGPLAYSIVFGRQQQELDDPARRLRPAHRLARRPSSVDHGEHRPMQQQDDTSGGGRAAAAPASRPRTATGTWRARRSSVDDPRQAPDRDGARRAVAGQTSATASTPSTSACRPWASTWPRASRRRFLTLDDEERTAVSAGLAGFPEDAIEYGRALADGRYVEDPAWILVATPTLEDPSRAPRGPAHGQVPLRPVLRLRGCPRTRRRGA